MGRVVRRHLTFEIMLMPALLLIVALVVTGITLKKLTFGFERVINLRRRHDDDRPAGTLRGKLLRGSAA